MLPLALFGCCSKTAKHSQVMLIDRMHSHRTGQGLSDLITMIDYV
ncbi:hypothetical protein HanPSC8_Chr15g0687661 [Helianthus annuus]|nr:hypothetical protein HanPSC8_Chr15g0687661 [Helianthus annuus]